MASNAEMRRLVLHAADRLAQESDHTDAIKAVSEIGYSDKRAPLTARLVSMAAAIALAEGTLRMVAACLADHEPEADAAIDSSDQEPTEPLTLVQVDTGDVAVLFRRCDLPPPLCWMNVSDGQMRTWAELLDLGAVTVMVPAGEV